MCAGSKKGWCTFWEISTGVLINSFQSHFKAVTRVEFSACGGYCVTVSDDGMARIWEVAMIVDQSQAENIVSVSSKKTIIPYRSWSPHTLSAKDLFLVSGLSSLRVFTCSTDRTVVMYDAHSGKQVLRISLAQSLECITCNALQDICFVGATNGNIFIIDLSVTAIGISAANATTGYIAPRAGAMNTSAESSNTSKGQSQLGNLPAGVSIMEGHTRAVTSLSCSIDNTTLVSSSEDGSLRIWDMWTKQCLREVKPMNKTALTNAIITIRPELIGSGVHKPSLSPIESLKKYPGSGGNSTVGEASNVSGGLNNRVVLASGVLGSHIEEKLNASQKYENGPDSFFKDTENSKENNGNQRNQKRARAEENEDIAEDNNDRNEKRRKNDQEVQKTESKGKGLGDSDFIALSAEGDDRGDYTDIDIADLVAPVVSLKGIGSSKKPGGSRANQQKTERSNEEDAITIKEDSDKKINSTKKRSKSIEVEEEETGTGEDIAIEIEEPKEEESKTKKIKDRKLPKDIKENPPARGKNASSKEKEKNLKGGRTKLRK